MKRWLNFSLQVLGFTAQVIIPTFVKNPQSQVTLHGAVGLAQLAVGMVAHNYNPDGTPAVLPYDPNAISKGSVDVKDVKY